MRNNFLCWSLSALLSCYSFPLKTEEVIQDFSNKISINRNIEDYLSSGELNKIYHDFESKRVPVLMFHNFGEKEDRFTISPTNFEKLLYELYSNDFYSVSLSEFVEGDFSRVPVGKKPILFTFDDAGKGQFLIKDGVISNKSAVGVLESFYESYDFGRGGVFFISYGVDNNFRLPFLQEEYASLKMKFLVNKGYDVAHHTISHNNNTYASLNNIFEQNVLSSAMFLYLLGDDVKKIKVDAFAHPFGASPVNKKVFDFLSSKYDVIFDAWGGSSPHPHSSKFNTYRIPRIEITYHTKDLVLNSSSSYVVSYESKMFYLFERREKTLINMNLSSKYLNKISFVNIQD